MDSHFQFGATAHPFILDRSAETHGGSRLLSNEQAKAMAAEAAAKANEGETPPCYEREVIPAADGSRGWTWAVWTLVGGERKDVVGPHRAWTKRAADRRAFRHYARLTEQAARLTREAHKR